MTVPVILDSTTINLAQGFPSSNYIEATIDLGSSADRWICVTVHQPGGSQTSASIGTCEIDPAGTPFTLTETSDDDTSALFGAARSASFRGSGGSMPTGSKVVRVNLESNARRATAFVIWGHTGTMSGAVVGNGGASASITSTAVTSTTNDLVVGSGWCSGGSGNVLITGTSSTTVLHGDLSDGLQTYEGAYGMYKTGGASSATLTGDITGYGPTPVYSSYAWLVTGVGSGQSQAPRSIHQFNQRRR